MATLCASSPKKKVNAEWRKLLCSIPGYDPFREEDGFYFDVTEAEQRIEFIEKHLTFVEGAKAATPFILERWQKAIVANLFGWKDIETGYRRYRECLIMVARKNGKTPLCAAIGACVFAMDDEPGMQVYSAAAEAEQASITWRTGKNMMLNNPELAEGIIAYQRSIIRADDPMASWKYISADAKSKHGYNVHLAEVDELHVCDAEMVETLQSAMGARRQPLMIYLTTSDYQRDSICNRTHDYASKVRDGIIPDARFLPCIWEAKREDDWKDPKVWEKANPNLGVSKSLESMERECQKAQNEPTYENVFKRLHLNIRTEQNERAIQMDKWALCAKPINEAALTGKLCWGGLDIASTSDFTAFMLRFPFDDGHYEMILKLWVPKLGAIEREKKDRVPYTMWANKGLITLTEGNETDYDHVTEDIVELAKKYRIQNIGIDYNYQGLGIKQAVEKQCRIEFTSYSQTFRSMTMPTKQYLSLINSGNLWHGGHEVLTWMASNLMLAHGKEGEVRPTKDKSGDKIDGIVADIMAMGLAVGRDKNAGQSVYDRRGLTTL